MTGDVSPADDQSKGEATPHRLLILGGTTEASRLAAALAGRTDIAPLLSLAGRTVQPAAAPIPQRIGGFGGVAGLVTFLRDEVIAAVVDATHPFAVRISTNAIEACREAGIPLARFTRPAWDPAPGDRWVRVADIGAAVATLCGLEPDVSSSTTAILSRPQSGRVEGCTRSGLPGSGSLGAPRPSTRSLRDRFRMAGVERRQLRVFLTTGRLDLARFRAAPQHQYLIRTIEPPDGAELPLNANVLLARPPFAVVDEVALMRSHSIDLLVTKNSGGQTSAAKLAAARELGVPVLMIDRPPPSGALELDSLEATLAWIEAQPRRP